VAVATAFVGMGGWHDFLVAVANGRSSSWYLVPSPIQALGPGIGTVVGYGAAGLALAGASWIRNERVAFALLGWAMILPAPDWWSRYLLVPLAAILPFAAGRLPRRVKRASSGRAPHCNGVHTVRASSRATPARSRTVCGVCESDDLMRPGRAVAGFAALIALTTCGHAPCVTSAGTRMGRRHPVPSSRSARPSAGLAGQAALLRVRL